MSIIKIQLLEQSTFLGFSTTFLLLADLSSPAVLATFTSSHNHHPFLNFRHVLLPGGIMNDHRHYSTALLSISIDLNSNITQSRLNVKHNSKSTCLYSKKDKKASVRKCGRNVKRRLRDLLKITLVVHMTVCFSYPFVSVY